MKRISFFCILAIAILHGTIVQATTFDTNSEVFASNYNYWPFGDAKNQRYQLWFSQNMMSGYSGTVTSISHFVDGDSRNSSYYVDIYASSTNLDSASLSSMSLDSNSGSDRTLIFSGITDLNSQSTLSIDVNPVFTYNGNGNLLLDYIFYSFNGVGDYYDGPTMQAVGYNSDFYRVTSHAGEGSDVLDWGAIRTEINFDNASQVPEPSSIVLLGLGIAGIGFLRKRFRQ